MHCPTLSELPSPPPGRIGWPWTEETPQLHDTVPNGSPWPRISIVTPSYNQGQFIEETIRSVLLQGYPNLEYIIIDGGSTDNSVEIIERYEPWLAYWVSEKDKGQSHAINKGFARSTGEIMAWLNSDDYYAPFALSMVATSFSMTRTLWVAGKTLRINLGGNLTEGIGKPFEEIENWFVGDLYSQSSVFWKKALWEKCGKLDENLNYSFDYDLWLRFAHCQPFALWIDQLLAYTRFHASSKTFTNKRQFILEDKFVLANNKDLIPSFWERIKVWFLVRERKADKKLSIVDKTESGPKKIFLGFLYAPWYVFSWKFYYKLKVLLFD